MGQDSERGNAAQKGGEAVQKAPKRVDFQGDEVVFEFLGFQYRHKLPEGISVVSSDSKDSSAETRSEPKSDKEKGQDQVSSQGVSR